MCEYNMRVKFKNINKPGVTENKLDSCLTEKKTKRAAAARST